LGAVPRNTAPVAERALASLEAQPSKSTVEVQQSKFNDQNRPSKLEPFEHPF